MTLDHNSAFYLLGNEQAVVNMRLAWHNDAFDFALRAVDELLRATTSKRDRARLLRCRWAILDGLHPEDSQAAAQEFLAAYPPDGGREFDRLEVLAAHSMLHRCEGHRDQALEAWGEEMALLELSAESEADLVVKCEGFLEFGALMYDSAEAGSLEISTSCCLHIATISGERDEHALRYMHMLALRNLCACLEAAGEEEKLSGAVHHCALAVVEVFGKRTPIGRGLLEELLDMAGEIGPEEKRDLVETIQSKE